MSQNTRREQTFSPPASQQADRDASRTTLQAVTRGFTNRLASPRDPSKQPQQFGTPQKGITTTSTDNWIQGAGLAPITTPTRIESGNAVYEGVAFIESQRNPAPLVYCGASAKATFIGCKFTRMTLGTYLQVTPGGKVSLIGCVFTGGIPSCILVDNTAGVITDANLIGCCNMTAGLVSLNVTDIGGI